MKSGHSFLPVLRFSNALWNHFKYKTAGWILL